MKKFLSLSLGLIFIGNFLSAQNFTAVVNGNWSNPATWGALTYPGAGAGTLLVTIPNGIAVTLDVSPLNSIDTLVIAGGSGYNSLIISDNMTLNETTGVAIVGATTGSGPFVKSLIMNGANAVLNARSLILVPGNAADKFASVIFNGGGTINLTANVLAGTTAANIIRTPIVFSGGGTLNVGGNISGGRITVGGAGTSTINISGVASTAGRLIM